MLGKFCKHELPDHLWTPPAVSAQESVPTQPWETFGRCLSNRQEEGREWLVNSHAPPCPPPLTGKFLWLHLCSYCFFLPFFT